MSTSSKQLAIRRTRQGQAVWYSRFRLVGEEQINFVMKQAEACGCSATTIASQILNSELSRLIHLSKDKH